MLKATTALMAITGTSGFALAAYNAHEHTYRAIAQPPTGNFVPTRSVSIIIKNLNEEGYIARCIESLLNQSIIKRHPEFFEIVLVDGGSDDRSIEIAEQYPIKIVHTHRGILHQMNTGIQNTNGDIIVFTDSDSAYPAYWLEKMLEFFDEDVSLIHTSFLHDETGNPLLPLGNLLKTLTGIANGGGQAIRRTVFEQKGLFDEAKDCVYVPRVFQEAEMTVVEKASALGKVIYQWDNPFFTVYRRWNLPAIQHECIRNPGAPNCRFAQEVGVTRF